MSAVVKPTPDVLDRYSPEQLAHLVDIAEGVKQKQAEGRELGRINNRARSTAHRAQRLEKAKALSLAMPYLKRDQLAAQVYQWCVSQAIRKKNGTHYALGTIINELRAAGYKAS